MERGTYKTMTTWKRQIIVHRCQRGDKKKKKKKREGWEAQYLKFAKFITAYSK